jgi:hypothetical protein
VEGGDEPVCDSLRRPIHPREGLTGESLKHYAQRLTHRKSDRPAGSDAAKSFSQICNSNRTVALSGGPETLIPGRYFNPDRSGQGWDFFWYGPALPGQSGGGSGTAAQSQVGNRLFVVWYTHEWVGATPTTRTLQPVWFGAVSDFAWENATATAAPLSWSGTLYRFRAIESTVGGSGVDTFRQWLPDFLGIGSPNLEHASQVGNVTLYFGGAGGLIAGTRPNQVAARWQLTTNYGFPASPAAQASPAEDCLTNFIADGNTYQPDYHRSGVYLDRSAAGWFWTPIFWSQGALKYEHHGLAYFDALTAPASGQLMGGGHPRWLVGFPEQADPAHACYQFWAAHGGSLGQHWSPSTTMCMARVSFANPSALEYYVPWLTQRPYTLTKVAALRRTNIPEAPASATSSISLRPLVADGTLTFLRHRQGTGLVAPDFLETGPDSPQSASVEKVIGLTRVRVSGNPQVLPSETECRVSRNDSFTPGTCNAVAHWATEGAYLNLTVRMRRAVTVGPAQAIELSRGLLRSPWDGLPLSRPLSQPGNSLGAPTATTGPLPGETITLEAYESPSAATPIAVSPTFVVRPSLSSCSLIDTGRPLDTPPTDIRLTENAASAAITVSATIPVQSTSTAQRATGIRYRLFEAISGSGTGAGNLTRYVGEQQFALPQTAAATSHSTTFTQLEPGKSYAAVVDAYNECNFVTAQPVARQLAHSNVPDRTLTDSPQPVTDHDPTVGLVPQTSGVSGGAATFEFPVEVPPGIQGMQPKLTLAYSSRAGNAVAGMGMSLAGLSTIHRCPQTRATDGAPRAVDFTENDRLCLDGQRLIALNGANYGLAGTTYRTEIDQYLRVTQLSGDLGLQSRGATFTVEYKSGEQMHFGGSDAAGQLWHVAVSRVPGAAVDTALSWALRRHSNRAGNFVEYRYQDFGGGELLPTNITYTGIGATGITGGTNGDREVRLSYGLRPDPTNSFVGGAETRQSRRLTAIKTYVASNEVRQYTLEYGASPSASSGRSLLRSVQVCARETAANGAGSFCLPPTVIDWQESPDVRVVRTIGSATGPSAPFSYTPQAYVTTFRSAAGEAPTAPIFSLRKIADLDGDGTVEQLLTSVVPSQPSSLRAQLVTLTADRQMSGALVLGATDAARLEFVTAIGNAVDLNNDGRSEVWFTSAVGDVTQSCASATTCGLGVMSWISGAQLPPPGAGLQPPLSTYMTSSSVQFAASSGEVGAGVPVAPPGTNRSLLQFADADGDGLPELFTVIWPSASPAADGTQTSCAQVVRPGLTPITLVNGPELRVYKNVSTGSAIRFLQSPMHRLCIPRARCVFRAKPVTDSSASRSPIPRQAGH